MLPFLEERQCVGLRCDQLRKSDRGPLLSDYGFSREFQPGKVHEICEPNGSGKTSLLRIIAGLEMPELGKLELVGKSEKSQRSRNFYLDHELERAGLIAWLPAEDDYSLSCLTLDVVVAGRWRFHQGNPKPEDFNAALAMLKILGTNDLALRDVVTLSSGQKRRISLARTLIQDADIVVLDEPFRGLDQESRGTVKQCIETVASRGRTIICANPAQPIWTTCV